MTQDLRTRLQQVIEEFRVSRDRVRDHPERAYLATYVDVLNKLESLLAVVPADAPPVLEKQRLVLDAIVTAMEAMQAAGFYLHDAKGEAVTRERFIDAVTIGLDAGLKVIDAQKSAPVVIDPAGASRYKPWDVQAIGGEWVKAADYDALRITCQQLRDENEALTRAGEPVTIPSARSAAAGD